MNRSGHFFALALCAASLSACGDGAGGGTKPVDAARSDATLMDAATEDAAPGEDARAEADALGCDAQVCDDAGQCACEPCPPGTLDCPCAESDAGVADLCGEDLLCGDDSKCIACEFGTDGCRCRPETDADAGLSRCDPGFACNEDGLCAACSNGEVGCPCIEGACGDGLLCGVGDVCRSPRTCGEVGCVRGQVCQAESAGQDAVCTPACEAGYAPWNAAAPGCVALPSCAEGDPGSIARRCAAPMPTMRAVSIPPPPEAPMSPMLREVLLCSAPILPAYAYHNPRRGRRRVCAPPKDKLAIKKFVADSQY
jgi:hypothetical protein